MNVEIQSKESTPITSNNIAVLTAEINSYKKLAGQAIFEIGRRLKSVHDANIDSENAEERKLAEQRESLGGWLKWLGEHVEFTRQTATRFIQAFEQLGSGTTSYHLDSGKIFELISLPADVDRADFVSQPHTIPSTGETKSVDEMTVRELREVKRELKAERESREIAERQRDEALESARTMRDTLESIHDDVHEIKTGTEISGRSLEFSASVRDFLKRYSFMTHFDAEFSTMNDRSAKEYQTAVDGMYDFLDGISKMLPSRRNRESIIIEAN
ncbi:DUF3102 domain-containing protein [Brevibacillus laterosporus]|uniref:DUF3102 domain-containing protein n=1 Tax=Brevibacillus laterosporus TaxID=1465 RepID=A0A518V998_BRELA|nr:DUF3102 domain-containing protein [Brevibacillus laterosporus]